MSLICWQIQSYAIRSDKHEKTSTTGPQKHLLWEGNPCNLLSADQLGSKWSHGSISVGVIPAELMPPQYFGGDFFLLVLMWSPGLPSPKNLKSSHNCIFLKSYFSESTPIGGVVSIWCLWCKFFEDMEVLDNKATCLCLCVPTISLNLVLVKCIHGKTLY